MCFSLQFLSGTSGIHPVNLIQLHFIKNVVFLDVASCTSCVNRCLQPSAQAGSSLADFSTLKMEAIHSSKMSVHTRSIQCHIPGDGILHSQRRENLKSYIFYPNILSVVQGMKLFITQFYFILIFLHLFMSKYSPQHFSFKQICSSLRERKQVTYPYKKVKLQLCIV
jgi:hypothetical protein